MEQYTNVSVEIIDNKIDSVYIRPSIFRCYDYIDWHFNYDKGKPEFIAEIVISDDIRGTLSKSTLGVGVTYHQTIKSESMLDATATVLDIVNNRVLNIEFATQLKNKEIELLEKQSQELLEKANKLKGVIK